MALRAGARVPTVGLASRRLLGVRSKLSRTSPDLFGLRHSTLLHLGSLFDNAVQV
jgi:hypothetical protein